MRYTDEFVERLKQLTYGQQRLVQESIRKLLSPEQDPTLLAHHLKRRGYFCSCSHRVRANLLIVFKVSRRNITFLSTGTHSQAYRPKP